MKRFKKIMLFVLFIGIAVIIFFIAKNSSKITYNEGFVQGNTGGNLLNSGLFCEMDDKIYFSNFNDRGALYSMNLDCTKFEKVLDDKVKYINVVGPYIYYTRNNNTREPASTSVLDFYSTGVYRVNTDGTKLSRLYSDPSGTINVCGNYVYFQRYNTTEGLRFYKIKIDGEEETKLSDQPISPASIQNGVMYYAGIDTDHYIHAIDLATEIDTIIYEGNCYTPIANNNYIYYISQEDNYNIYRINIDGTEPVKVVEEQCGTYNLSVSGKYLYYQVDGGDHNGIYCTNLETKEVTQIKSGDYKNLNITSDHVFFQDFKSDTTYIVPVGANSTVSIFSPPAGKEK